MVRARTKITWRNSRSDLEQIYKWPCDEREKSDNFTLYSAGMKVNFSWFFEGLTWWKERNYSWCRFCAILVFCNWLRDLITIYKKYYAKSSHFDLLFYWHEKVFIILETSLLLVADYNHVTTQCFVYESSIRFILTPFLYLYPPFLYTSKRIEDSALGREP